jgi:hypothetical protein
MEVPVHVWPWVSLKPTGCVIVTAQTAEAVEQCWTWRVVARTHLVFAGSWTKETQCASGRSAATCGSRRTRVEGEAAQALILHTRCSIPHCTYAVLLDVL